VVRTPNVDKIAAEGVVFTQAFTPFPLCTPARTSIFTGLYVKNHKVRHNVNVDYKPSPSGLSPDVTTFPELLVCAGYKTAGGWRGNAILSSRPISSTNIADTSSSEVIHPTSGRFGRTTSVTLKTGLSHRRSLRKITSILSSAT